MDPKMTPHRSDASSDTGTATPASPKKIRYSGDLELRLPFESSPMDKPSTSFRDPTAWFKDVKGSAEENVVMADDERSNKKDETREVVAVPPPSAAMFSSSSSSSMMQAGERGSKFFHRASLGFFGTGRRSTVGRNGGGVRFEETGGEEEDVGRVRHLSNDPLVQNSTMGRRPAGPRAFGDHHGLAGDTLKLRTLGAPSSSSSSSASTKIPTPPLYRQSRIYVYAVMAVLAATAVGLSVVSYRTAKGSEKGSFGFYLFVAVATGCVALAGLVGYIFLGGRLYAYYDAPYLFCQDIPSTTTTTTTSPRHNDPKDEEGSSMGGWLRKTADRFHHRNEAKSPSPWVPLLDLGIHLTLFFMWVSSLADMGVRVKQSSCNGTSADDKAVCEDFKGFERLVGCVGVGGLTGFVVMVCFGVKLWQVWEYGIVRSVIRRRG
ncbi:hypothetical protein HDU67_005541 [Dinochytrium kinnereticum]|nr:hypothetical protein HDU67_005541 [Dinochytrium kinnereticum]